MAGTPGRTSEYGRENKDVYRCQAGKNGLETKDTNNGK